MSTAGYLQDAKNQQKKLAENLTAKGVTASATEKYDSLVSKVAQIEELRGEERVLNNITQYNDTPESMVHIEYPEQKNLFDINNKPSIYVNLVNFAVDGNTFSFKNELTKQTSNVSFKIFLNTGVYYISGSVSQSDGLNGGWGLQDIKTSSYLYNNSSSGTVAGVINITESKYYYLNFFCNYNSVAGTTATYSNIQLELGSTATSYEPFKTYDIGVQLQSKNLIPYPYNSPIFTNNGITYTANSDGSITANGTFENITKTSYIAITPASVATAFKLPLGKTYTISGSPQVEGVNVKINYCNLKNGNTLDSGITENGVPKTFTTSTTVSLTGVQIYLKSQGTVTTVNNIVFKPQIELGSTTTPYTPYISNLSTVNVTRCGKNFLEYPYVETTLTRNGLTFTDNKDGTITVNGTATADTQFRLQDTVVYPNNPNPFNSLIGKKVYINGSPEGSSKDTYAIQWIHAGAYGNGVLTVTTSSYYRFAIFVKSGITVENLVFKPQIELGTTATSYEPYQGQTYTPTATGEVTGITNLYPTTTLLTDNAGVVFEQVTGGFYKEILPSADKNGITKVYQPSVDSSIDSNITSDNIKQGVSILGVTGDYICNYIYDETTKELVLIL